MVTKVTIITILIVSVVTLTAFPFVPTYYGLAAAAVGETSTPIIIWADKDSYDKNETVTISGKVDTVDGSQITLEVREIDYQDFPVIISFEFQPNQDGTFERSFSTDSLPKPGPYNVKAVYGNWEPDTQTAFTYTGALGAPPITVSTDRTSYSVGDAIRISGSVGTLIENVPVSITLIDPSGEIVALAQTDPYSNGSYFTTITAGGTMQISGDYTIITQYDSHKSSTTFYFVGTTTTLPTSPNTVFAPLGSSVPGCERTNECFIPAEITVNVGDTVKWKNKDSVVHTVTSGTAEDGPDGTFDSNMFMSGQTFSWTAKATGEYPYFCIVHPWMEGTVIVKGTSSGEIVDTIPPLLLTPSDMTIDATDSSGARVDYSVKAIDDNDGILRPNCSPSSGSLFPIGKTTVTCSATDYSGNSDRKSFVITVRAPDVIIPSWIKDVAGFWCGDEIDNASFIEAIQYLINNDVIIVPTTASSGYGSQEIPNWVKNNACWWSQGLISNSDFASGLQYLIGQGIIRV